MTKKILFSLTFMVLSCLAYGQVGIGTTSPHSGSILDLSAPDKALLVTRVANVTAISAPTNGMIVYDTSSNCFRGYQNGTWSDCGFVNYSVSGASASPTVCVNTSIPTITHATTGANGVGAASGLPPGVSASWANAVITITGTPTSSGVFNYSIPLTGGTAMVYATGTIFVGDIVTVGTASATPTVLSNYPMPSSIIHSFTGATGIGVPSGLPPGVSASLDNNNIIIAGTPTTAGVYNYTIPLLPNCGSYIATGTIKVVDNCSVKINSTTYKEFKCHNLGADTSLSPNIPNQDIHGAYYQWGSSSAVATAYTSSSTIVGWNTTAAVNGSWADNTKTTNDPCPSGFKVPKNTDFQAVAANNTLIRTGSWTVSSTNFSSALHFGPDLNSPILTFPTGGRRQPVNGLLANRGSQGQYWTSTEISTNNRAVFLYFDVGAIQYANNTERFTGLLVKCISE